LLRFGLDLWIIIAQRFECASISRAQVIRNNQLSVLFVEEVLGHGVLGLEWSAMGVVGGNVKIQAYTAVPFLAFGDRLSCH